MSVKIEQPYPVFRDKVGLPLDGGLIYIGVAGLNPETNPIQCYFDEDFMLVAPQPLRTINGYISRNGSPANIFLKVAECSITIKDRFRITQYTDLHFQLSNFGELRPDQIITDSGLSQKEINDQSVAHKTNVDDLKTFKKNAITQSVLLDDVSEWTVVSSGTPDNTMLVQANDGTLWKRNYAGKLNLKFFGETSDAATAFENLFSFVKTLTSKLSENGQPIRKIDIDLQGLIWETSRPIYGIQNIGGLNFVNGHIKAKDDFVGEYLVEFTDDEALRAYHYIFWNNIIFDGNRKTSCMKFNRFLKCGVTTCHFLRWKENGYGLVVGKSPIDTKGAAQEGHEFYVNGGSTFAQYDFSSVYSGAIPSGTALYINTYDGHYSDFVIAYCGRGIEHIRTGLNIFENLHIYGAQEKNYGFYIDCTGTNSFINLVNIYMDECSIRSLNPNQIIITNSKIFRNDDTNDGLIIFDTSVNYVDAYRVILENNHFNTSRISGKKQIQFVNNSGGLWGSSAGQYIKSNSNTMLGYVDLIETGTDIQDIYKWDGYAITKKYALDETGTFTLNLAQFHNKQNGQETSASCSEWLITSTWQSTNSDSVGAYKLVLFLMPSGNYIGSISAIGTPQGFSSTPSVSLNGILTVALNNFYRGAVFRTDSRQVKNIV